MACTNKKDSGKKLITKEMLLNMNRDLISAESKLIQKHLEDDKIEMQQTKSGLWYQILNDSIGDIARKGQMIHLIYKIEMLNGTLCYSSDQNGIWSFEVGKGNVESGMQEAVNMLSVGDSAQLIMPPHLAHGIAGDGDRIPGRTILKYNIKVMLIEDQDIN